jgi:alpha-beta hydrolase superfamily lysophospholipase
MATIICMDGLGGLPEVTFKSLRETLEKRGFDVSLAKVDGIQTHEDRIRRVISACNELDARKEKIFLLGLSAGASATRIAAERLSRAERKIAGVILISQAMPSGYFFLTMQLLKAMLRHLRELLLAKPIETTGEEYLNLIEPLSERHRNQMVYNRQTIPGAEARRLAFASYKLKGYSYPTLAIYGSDDRWIATRAHRQVCTDLRSLVPSLDEYEVLGSGHLPLASERRKEVIEKITNWIEDR